MSKIKVLNLYAGIGGNRKLWKNVDVTAVEIDENIAKVYQDHFPEDKVVIGDAHKYLLKHFKEFDFIWSSPPCPSHSQFRYRCGYRAGWYDDKPLFPDMKLYEEIIFLQYYFEGKWVVENVESYYKPLIKPYFVQRHFFWSNFVIPNNTGFKKDDIRNRERKTIEEKQEQYGFDLTNSEGIEKRKVLNNCVDSKLGLYVFNCAYKDVQQTIVNPPTSKSKILTLPKAKTINMRDEASAMPSPKDASHPSHHPNIKSNKINLL